MKSEPMNLNEVATEDLVAMLRHVSVETGSLACLGCGHEHNCGTRGCALIREAADRLDASRAPTLTPPNEWVSVEERLPTDEHPVLVFVGYADTMTGFITTSSYFCFDENPHWQWDGLVQDEQRTLFWMPLPAPPDRRPPEGEEDIK